MPGETFTTDAPPAEPAEPTPDTAESVNADAQPPQEPAPEPGQEPAAEPAPPDVNEQLAALRADVQALAPPKQEPEGDLFDQFAGGPEYGDPSQYQQPGETGPEGEPQYPGQPGEEDPFESMIRERVAEATYPMLMAQEEDRRRTRLEAMAEKYPQLREPETQEKIADVLVPMAERYGNELILTDPDFIGQVLMGLNAEAASAKEVPAEQAAQPANLESAAGASAPEAELTEEQKIIQGIKQSGSGKNAFV